MRNSADRIYRSTVVNKSQRQNADLILLDILLLAANTAAFAVCWFMEVRCILALTEWPGRVAFGHAESQI